jgi:flagellar hook protein FlgE
MSFESGLSGLNSASKDLDVIGNNVANSSVVGFKASNAHFADVFANSLSGSASNIQVGIGSKVAAVAQQFNQGTITATNNPLDVAINGKGFFRMDDSGTIEYARNGQFHFDAQGFIVNDNDLKLTGYGVDVNGNIVPTSPGPIQISFADVAPQSTTQLDAGLNLDSRETAPPTAVFSPIDPTSFNQSTSATVFDTLGNPHVLSTYYVKVTANPAAIPPIPANQWRVYGTIDGSLANADIGAGAGLPVTMNFNSSGAMTTAMPLNASVVTTTGAVTPLAFTLDFTGTTQFGSPFGVNNLTQDGFTSGRLSGLSVANDGTVVGNYTNGQTRNLAQVVIADFRNPQGLAPLGNNLWIDTAQSGLPIVGVPGSGSLGSLQSSAVEDSNIDLTAELVNMITAQRDYQANAQTIKTQDAVLQTLVNLR